MVELLAPVSGVDAVFNFGVFGVSVCNPKPVFAVEIPSVGVEEAPLNCAWAFFSYSSSILRMAP